MGSRNSDRIPRAPDELVFRVEMWTQDDNHVERLLALADNVLVGRGAFLAAVNQYPDRILTLRHGMRVIAKSPA
jgi:hypothetical protein